MFTFSRRIVVAMVSALAGLQAVPAAAQSEPILGQIMCAGFNFAPRGWAALDGQILSIAQNSALFSLLGTTYGGNGQTTFALPDMRGRNLVHQGQGPGLSNRVMGENGGSETTTLAAVNMPAHAHSFAPLGSTNDATSVSPAGKVAASKARTNLYATPTNLLAQESSVTGTAGGNVPVGNMSPFVTVSCFIALQGVYPSRN
jgi:microcystin-dependent protein